MKFKEDIRNTFPNNSYVFIVNNNIENIISFFIVEIKNMWLVIPIIQNSKDFG